MQISNSYPCIIGVLTEISNNNFYIFYICR
nr:MAG TPA: hypothetical protein [Caudoviricetes sp.]